VFTYSWERSCKLECAFKAGWVAVKPHVHESAVSKDDTNNQSLSNYSTEPALDSATAVAEDNPRLCCFSLASSPPLWEQQPQRQQLQQQPA
jgi:hypothetical protein